jgi:hypothetical protein
MRTKKFEKKLVFRKKTIANLTDNAMREVNGGEHYPLTYPPTSCGSDCYSYQFLPYACPWVCV